MRPFMKTPAQGAATSIHLATAPALEQMTGRYFANSKPRKSAKRSYDKTAAARLWHVSTDLINPGPKLKGAVDNVTSWPRTRGFRGALDIPPFPESTERFSEGLLDGEQPAEMPGHSRFLRDGNKIFHTHSAFGRGNEYPQQAGLYRPLLWRPHGQLGSCVGSPYAGQRLQLGMHPLP